MKLCTSCREWGFPLNWGKYHRISVSGLATFFFSKSYLFKNNIMEALANSLMFTIVRNMALESSSLLILWSSSRTWSNSEDETINKIEVTELKHGIHFLLWLFCPPTSTKRKGMLFIGITNSFIPVVAFLVYKISEWVGMYVGFARRSKLFRKYSKESLWKKNCVN